MKLYGIVNTVKVMSSCAINLLILFLDRLSKFPYLAETHLFMSLRVYDYIPNVLWKGKFINSIQSVSFIPFVNISHLLEQNAGQVSFSIGQVKKYFTCPVDKWNFF